MKRISLLVACVFMLISMACPLNAQIKEFAEEILSAAKEAATTPTLTNTDSLRRQDSIRMQELTLQVQELKLNEMTLRAALDDSKKLGQAADSAKLEQRRHQIDSLRNHTKGIPVVIDEDTLFTVYANRGGLSAADRVAEIEKVINTLGGKRKKQSDSIYIYETELVTDIMCGEKVIFGITDQDALWQNVSREELAQKYMPVITSKVDELREHHSFLQLMKRALYFVLVLAIQYILFIITTFLYKKLKRFVVNLQKTKLKPISIRDYEFLSCKKEARILIFLSNVLRYTIVLVQLMITVPIMFSIFPQTENLAIRIFSYMLQPVKMIVSSVVNYIPNLFIILAIYYCIKYTIKGLQYMANEIESEKLKITGFYPDWAQPSFNIIRFLLYAFMIAMVYQYLPGSNTGVFQGVSVFVGLIVSLGSSTVIGNIIAGLVITYMRPFKLGDRIKLNDTTGNVIEKTPFVTRIRTPKNEVVTIPNSFIMSSHTINYSSSARNYGLIVHSTVTIGYDAPWREVHQLLIDAALATPGITDDPKPFVLETELSDFYPVYQINAYIHDADRLAQIYSDLHQNIQDKFNEAGVEIMSPHYRAGRDGNTSTIPEQYRRPRK